MLTVCKRYEQFGLAGFFPSFHIAILKDGGSYGVCMVSRSHHQMAHPQSQPSPEVIHPFIQQLIPVNNTSAVTLEHCCDRLRALMSLSFICKWWVSATSDLFCNCECLRGGGSHQRIQWLKGESRLIKVTRNAAISAEQQRWKILLDSVLNKTSKRRPHGLKTGGVKRRLSPEGGSWPFKSQQLPRRVSCFHVCWRHSFIVTYAHK